MELCKPTTCYKGERANGTEKKSVNVINPAGGTKNGCGVLN